MSSIGSFFNLRSHSLLRGNVMVLGSLAAAFKLARFPLNQPSLVMIFPVLCAAAGMAETFRCLQTRWNWYSGAVLISLYMDALVLTMILFLAIYPLFTRVG